MMWKILALAMLCFSMSAAEMPEGWNIYLSPKNAAAGSVTAKDGNIRIVDPDNKVEIGIVKTFNCQPGDYFRLTVDIQKAGDTAFKEMEISSYYVPARKERAGTLRINKTGKQVLVTGPAPAGVKKIQFFVYSYRRSANDVLVSIPKVETSKTPFAAK